MSLLKLKKNNHSDLFQTPFWPIKTLYDTVGGEIFAPWDPCCGKGNIIKSFSELGITGCGTDILNKQDFLDRDFCPNFDYSCIITNPPYSLKDKFLARCYQLNKPFALLLPLTALEGKKRQQLYRDFGMQLIVLPKRVNFETPSGKGKGAWFPVGWFTHGFNLWQDMVFAD